jgi:type VI protein secretion system component Hcp
MDITVNFDRDGNPANAFTVSAESFSWGMTHAGSGGTPQGAPVLGDLTFTAVSSQQTSPALKLACTDGTMYASVTVSVTDPSGQHPVPMDVVLANAFVSSFQTGGASSQSFPVDMVSLNANVVGVL